MQAFGKGFYLSTTVFWCNSKSGSSRFDGGIQLARPNMGNRYLEPSNCRIYIAVPLGRPRGIRLYRFVCLGDRDRIVPGPEKGTRGVEMLFCACERHLTPELVECARPNDVTDFRSAADRILRTLDFAEVATCPRFS